MAVLTPLNLAAARRLGALFDLEVVSVRGIPAGSVNSNFELTLQGGGRAFLRVYEEQGAAAAAKEASMLEHLASRGVSTPRPMSLAAGGFLAEHAGKPVAVFPWIDGEVLCTARVTPDAARRCGEALARVHVAGEGCDVATSRFETADLRARIDGVLAGAAPNVTHEVRSCLRVLGGHLDSLEGRRTPARLHGLIHGDLFRDNVLFGADGRIAALLDFESASRGSRAFDLVVTMLAWCFGDDLDQGLAGAMAAGYVSVRPLSRGETACLYDEARFAAVRFATTRITDFELRPRGLGVFKDYRRFIARYDAVVRIGEARLEAWLGLG